MANVAELNGAVNYCLRRSAWHGGKASPTVRCARTFPDTAALHRRECSRTGRNASSGLNQQALQLPCRLADVFLNKAAPGLFGVSSDLLQALLQVLPPMSDVLVQQVVFALGDNLIDQRFQLAGCHDEAAKLN